MFLNSLKDSQKKLFLDLAIKAADASGGISSQEKNMLKAFALEMRIPARYDCGKSENEILDFRIVIIVIWEIKHVAVICHKRLIRPFLRIDKSQGDILPTVLTAA